MNVCFSLLQQFDASKNNRKRGVASQILAGLDDSDLASDQSAYSREIRRIREQGASGPVDRFA
jgi:hypothetical protein